MVTFLEWVPRVSWLFGFAPEPTTRTRGQNDPQRILPGLSTTCASQLNGHSPFPTGGRRNSSSQQSWEGMAVPRRVDKNLSGSEPLRRFAEKKKITTETLGKQVVTP